MPIRLLVWLAIVAVVVAGAYVGVRAWTDRSWYIGVDDGHVAIYRGLPVTIGAIHLSHVVQGTDIRETDVMPYFLPRLKDGVRQPSLADARAYLATLPLTPEAQKARATPTPTPSAKVSPKASAT